MKRWFSLALVLALCLTTVLGDVAVGVAEDADVVDVEIVDAYESSDAGEDWLPVDETKEAVDAKPEVEEVVGDAVDASGNVIGDAAGESEEVDIVGDAPEEDEFSAEAPEAEPFADADETRDETSASEEDAVPELWYARAISSITLEIDETVSRNIPKGSILLVTEKPADAMLHVVCENLSGDVDAALLEALTCEEVQSFMDALTQVEVTFYRDLLDYPLPPEPVEVNIESEEEAEPVDAEEATEEAQEAAIPERSEEEAAEDAVPEASEEDANPEAAEADVMPEDSEATATPEDAEPDGSEIAADVEASTEETEAEAEASEEVEAPAESAVPENDETIEKVDVPEDEEASKEVAVPDDIESIDEVTASEDEVSTEDTSAAEKNAISEKAVSTEKAVPAEKDEAVAASETAVNDEAGDIPETPIEEEYNVNPEDTEAPATAEPSEEGTEAIESGTDAAEGAEAHAETEPEASTDARSETPAPVEPEAPAEAEPETVPVIIESEAPAATEAPAEKAVIAEEGDKAEGAEPVAPAMTADGVEEAGEKQETVADKATDDAEVIEDAPVDQAVQEEEQPEEIEELAVFNEAAESDTAQAGVEPAETDPAETDPVEEPTVASDGIPAGIQLSTDSLVLGLREVYKDLTASVVDASGTPVEGQTVSWTSSNTKVVKVDATGKLTAKKRGKATIVASAEGLPEVAVSVVVRKAPSKVKLTPKKGNLGVGMVLQLTAKLSKKSGSAALKYTSSNPAVATVDANGLVTGVGAGKATITVRTFNKKKAKCKVTVYSEPASITTGKDEYAILQGVTEKLAINVLDASGAKTYANLDVVSSDPAVVAVDNSGNITGVSNGSAVVTITTHNGLSTSCAVDVCGQAADMTLNAKTITIGVKEKYDRLSYTLIPPEGQDRCAAVVTWKSRNKKIAKVNAATGVVTGVKAGTTYIVATMNNGISKRLTVVVKKAPKTVKLSPDTLTLTPGMSSLLVASYNSKDVNDNVTYTSSDESVAVVDDNGLVTAVGNGTAIITVETYNGKKGTCTVTVTELPFQVLMTETLTLAVGMREKLECSALDVDGQTAMAEYSFTAVEESGAVTVDESGEVTGVRAGTARVLVSTHNGVTTHQDESGNTVETECVVTIVEAPTEIRMDESVEIEVGESYTLKPRLYTADGMQTDIGSYEIATTSDCITLDDDGTVTGLGAGTATVTATAFNGLTATCQVKVTRRYRMYAVYNFYNVSEKGSLSFPKNNATSFQEVMGKSDISGISYENLGIQANETKSSLLSKLKSAFSDSRDTDVNLIYMCSHGTNYVDVPSSAGSTHYGLQLPGYSNYNSSSKYYLTSEEIFDAISAIKGQVILVLDSCYSGQFIVNMKASLDREEGRISVMTAATNTRACYYNISDTSRACDFFTMYLLLGAGYDMRTHVDTGSYPADANGDGKLTFNEMFSYAKKSVTANVPNYKNKSWFHGDANQTPYVYRGDNGDLVLFQYN